MIDNRNHFTTNTKKAMNNKKASKKVNNSKRAKTNARQKTNKRWKYVEASARYCQAAIGQLCSVITNKIEMEVLDGIFLNLKVKSQVKPSHVQERILRRIIEKRLAQASHKIHGRPENLTTIHVTRTSTSKCMEDIRKKRHAA
jgi:hypothetical protein